LISLNKFFIGHLFWLQELKIKDDCEVAILVFIGVSELFIIYYFLAVSFEERIYIYSYINLLSTSGGTVGECGLQDSRMEDLCIP
jgi:hypothetical protein